WTPPCHQKKGEKGAGAGAGTGSDSWSQPHRVRVRVRARVRAGDWTCPRRQAHNSSNKQQCSCYGSSPVATLVAD
ncbi:unnamed protein product, partial [Discosporangium mesarthrocarpum]